MPGLLICGAGRRQRIIMFIRILPNKERASRRGARGSCFAVPPSFGLATISADTTHRAISRAVITLPLRRSLVAMMLFGPELPGPFQPCAGVGSHLTRLSEPRLGLYSSRSAPVPYSVGGHRRLSLSGCQAMLLTGSTMRTRRSQGASRPQAQPPDPTACAAMSRPCLPCPDSTLPCPLPLH
jgi:hypothetical protein